MIQALIGLLLIALIIYAIAYFIEAFFVTLTWLSSNTLLLIEKCFFISDIIPPWVTWGIFGLFIGLLLAAYKSASHPRYWHLRLLFIILPIFVLVELGGYNASRLREPLGKVTQSGDPKASQPKQHSPTKTDSQKTPNPCIATVPPDPIDSSVAVVFPLGPYLASDVWVTSLYDYGDNFGVNDNKLQVGGWGDWYYSLLEFRLDKYPKDVKRVLLELYCYPRGDKSLATEMYLDRLLAPWDEDVSWASQPDAVTVAGLVAPTHTNDWYRISKLWSQTATAIQQ